MVQFMEVSLGFGFGDLLSENVDFLLELVDIFIVVVGQSVKTH